MSTFALNLNEVIAQICRLCQVRDFSSVTTKVAVKLFERHHSLFHDKHLVALACISLAGKYHDTASIDLYALTQIGTKRYKVEEMSQMEESIFKAVLAKQESSLQWMEYNEHLDNEDNLVASGSQSNVISLTYPYVCKRFHIMPKHGIQYSFVREISILLSLDHPNVMKVERVLTDLSGYVMLEGEDLEGWVMTLKNRQTPYNLQIQLAKELFSAITYIHSASILHRDIKPNNIIVYCDAPDEYRFVLADFGSARDTLSHLGEGMRKTTHSCAPLYPKLTQHICTLWYRAPEIILGVKYTEKVDVWSALCVLYFVGTGSDLFKSSTDGGHIESIFRLLGTPTEESWPGITSLIDSSSFALSSVRYAPLSHILTSYHLCPEYQAILCKYLVMDPNDRPDARDILNLL